MSYSEIYTHLYKLEQAIHEESSKNGRLEDERDSLNKVIHDHQITINAHELNHQLISQERDAALDERDLARKEMKNLVSDMENCIPFLSDLLDKTIIRSKDKDSALMALKLFKKRIQRQKELDDANITP